MDLKTFLLARIAEDEALAREEDDDYADTTLLPTYDSEHQANWNTDRVLAECAAKRAIINYFALEAEKMADPRKRQAASEPEWWLMRAAETTLQSLASVYADHPDYQPEWKL